MSCKYCTGDEPIYESWDSDWTIDIIGKELIADKHYNGVIAVEVNYCPMCGEKLVAEVKEVKPQRVVFDGGHGYE